MSGPLVLCYHAVSPSWPADLALPPERLERQLRFLLGKGYRPVTFAEAAAAPRGAKLVAATFDDAFASVLERAQPIMARLGVPGTVFVPTDYPDAPPPMAWPGTDRWVGTAHEHELRSMSWEEIRGLAEDGWEVGSHTRSHPRLTQLDDSALDGELRGSRDELEERLGRPCRTLAYPYGDVDERVAAAAGRAGYEFAGALGSRLTAGDPLRSPRVGVYNADAGWRFRLKASGAMRALRASPAWALLERLPRPRAG